MFVIVVRGNAKYCSLGPCQVKVNANGVLVMFSTSFLKATAMTLVGGEPVSRVGVFKVQNSEGCPGVICI